MKSEIVLADRFLIGLDIVGFAYSKNVGGNEFSGIYQCGVDQGKSTDNKTGNILRDECGNKATDQFESETQKIPNVSLELEFGKPSRWCVF